MRKLKHLPLSVRVPIEEDNPSIVRLEEKCIRCGMCVRACPTNAVHFRCGFGTGKQGTVLPEKTNKQMNDIVKEKKS